MKPASRTRFRFAGREFVVIGLGEQRSVLDELPAGMRDVARRILEGESNLAIAKARGTSARTVAKQVAAVFQRLGVGSRAELVGLVTGSTERD